MAPQAASVAVWTDTDAVHAHAGSTSGAIERLDALLVAGLELARKRIIAVAVLDAVATQVESCVVHRRPVAVASLVGRGQEPLGQTFTQVLLIRPIGEMHAGCWRRKRLPSPSDRRRRRLRGHARLTDDGTIARLLALRVGSLELARERIVAVAVLDARATQSSFLNSRCTKQPRWQSDKYS